MNFSTILKPLIIILFFVALCMFFPILVALYYDEPEALKSFFSVMVSVATVCAAATR